MKIPKGLLKFTRVDIIFRRAFKEAWIRWRPMIHREMNKSLGDPTIIQRRTGQLQRAINAGVWQYDAIIPAPHTDLPEGDKRNHIIMNFVIPVPYAAILEMGTVGAGGKMPDIIPRNKKALTVPLSEALSASKIPTRVAMAAKTPGTPEYEEAFIRDGIIYLPEDNRLIPLWRLMDRVALKPTNWFSKSAEKSSRYLAEVMAVGLSTVIQKQIEA